MDLLNGPFNADFAWTNKGNQVFFPESTDSAITGFSVDGLRLIIQAVKLIL